MASSGYYHTPNYYYSSSYGQPPAVREGGPRLPLHLCLFLGTLLLLATTSLHARYESALESLAEQLRLLLILSPLLLLFVAQYWMAATERRSGQFLVPLLPPPLDSSYHAGRAGGGASPWGVALVLVLVLFLVSYQSSFQDWWFPLFSR